MKRRGMAIILTVVLALSGIIFGVVRRSNGALQVKTSTVSKGDIVVYYSTSGTVEAKNSREYYVQTPSKVLKLNVAIGDTVKKGDIIAELDVQDLSTQLKIAQKNYENAKIQLNALKTAKAELSKNSQTSEVQGQIPQVSQITKDGQTAQGGQTGQMSLDDQIKMQENAVEIARLNVKSIEDSINKQQRYIKADADGIISILNLKEGATANVGVPAAVVSDTSSLVVNLNINQYDVSNLKEGQEAFIKFGGKTFKGVVSRINPIATKSVSATGSETVVKVTVDISNNDGTLKSGYDVDVDIKTGEKSGIIKIPAEAMITDKNDNESVYVIENGVAIKKKVKIGLTSDVETEIIEGLKEGDKVILNPSSNITDGTKVIEKGEEQQ